ncbi:MAG: acetyl-CoA carboxylase biotin carboxyl carrier protein [bacterium]|nr:acetyl-CoA carboxylase biotin carboxyl carrier protein [bacterium]
MTSKAAFKENVVRQLAEILNETNLTEIEYEIEGSRIRVVREPQTVVAQAISAPIQTAAPAAPAEVPAPIATDLSNAVKSPMVGTVYHSSSPDAPAFVKVGNAITEGQTLLIIEAMKVMNPLRAPRAGVVKEILVQNSEPVEFDQPLLIVE